MKSTNQSDVAMNGKTYTSPSLDTQPEEPHEANSSGEPTVQNANLDDCLRVLLHNKMRDTDQHSFEIVNAIAELSLAYDIGLNQEKSKPFEDYVVEHRLRRTLLIKDLREKLAIDFGVVVEETTIEKWLVFCAERALLIDVPDEPDPTVQPLYRAEFSQIDNAFREGVDDPYDEDFFAALIVGPLKDERPTYMM